MHKITQSAWDFFAETNPPQEEYQLNFLESAGNTLLFPLATSLGRLRIKYLPNESHLIATIQAVALAIITIPLTLIGCTLKGIGRLLPHPAVVIDDRTIEPTDAMKIQQCYDLSSTLREVCIENGFIHPDHPDMPLFSMLAGTALGAVRHGGIIPWDDDCDFMIFQKHEDLFRALFQKLREKGIEIDETLRADSTYKMHFSDQAIREKYGQDPSLHTTGAIDVFIWSEMSDGDYTYDRPISRMRWAREYFTKEEIEGGFTLHPFGPQQIPLPMLANPIGYLKRSYGENCLTHGIQTHGHFNIDLGPFQFQLPFFKLGSVYYKITT